MEVFDRLYNLEKDLNKLNREVDELLSKKEKIEDEIKNIKSEYSFEEICRRFKKLEGCYVAEPLPSSTHFIWYKQVINDIEDKLTLKYICFSVYNKKETNISLNHIDYCYNKTNCNLEILFQRLDNTKILSKKEFISEFNRQVLKAYNELSDVTITEED
jgi:hypothetical protein